MKKNAQRGISLIEVIGALAVGALIMMGTTTMIDSSVDDVKGQQTALYQEQVTKAAGKYITKNYTTLVTDTNSGATSTITVAQLKADGFLSNSFSSTNSFNQTPCVLVRQPSTGKLDALVATYGGMAIPDQNLPYMAMNAGQGGGYISAAAPGTARGASWELVTTSYRDVSCGGSGAKVLTGADGGHLVSSLFYDGPGQLSTDFLYRNSVPLRPELNQMNTSLTMNEKIIMSGNALVTPKTACGTQAAFGIDDATRSLLVCGKDGFWSAPTSWKEPVEDYGDLPATGNVDGDVHILKNSGRAFMYNGGTWIALAVDDAGNLDVPGTLSANSITSSGAMTAQGDITSNGAVTASGTVTGNGVRGNWVTGTYWLEGPSLYINQTVAAGSACQIPNANGPATNPVGIAKHDDNGYLLSCVWTPSGYKFLYENGSTTMP